MRIKNGFVLHEVCSEHIIVAEGKENIDFNNIISLNETATLIWNNIVDKDFTVADMAAVLLKEYDVDEATATADCTTLINQWIAAGIINE